MRSSRNAGIFVCLAVLSAPARSLAQQNHAPVLTVGTLTEGSEPAIDGTVDDDIWNSVIPYSTFTQQEPNEGEPATERTEIRFLADRKNLYISVIAFDASPSALS
jgi:hypothetical protein